MSQYAKLKELWTLDRKESTPSNLVWTRTHKVRRRENGKRVVVPTRELITCKRSDDAHLFTGRSAPRTPPATVSATTPHKAVTAVIQPNARVRADTPIAKTSAVSSQRELAFPTFRLTSFAQSPKPRLFSPGDSKRRPGRDKDTSQQKGLQQSVNAARVETLNRIRTGNQARALRGHSLDTAVFNVV